MLSLLYITQLVKIVIEFSISGVILIKFNIAGAKPLQNQGQILQIYRGDKTSSQGQESTYTEYYAEKLF
jgi:hypothetical protein